MAVPQLHVGQLVRAEHAALGVEVAGLEFDGWGAHGVFLEWMQEENGPRSYLCGPFLQVLLDYFFRLSWAPSLL